MKKKISFIAIGIIGFFTLSSMVLFGISVMSARPMYRQKLKPEEANNVNIFEPERALTFARYMKEEEPQLLLVTSYEEGMVTGITINDILEDRIDDPIKLFKANGYEKILSLLEEREHTVTISEQSLIKPADFARHHIAIGYNYLCHVEEVKEEESPFIFPKKVEPAKFNSAIAIHDYVLPDYELEMGMVVLEDLYRNDQTIEYLGFLLVNDFSDRRPIVDKHVDVAMGKIEELPDGIQGYPLAKNKKGAFPVGNLFVIPADYKSFLENLEITLYLNGELRQVAHSSDIIWGPEKCIEETFKRSDWEFEAGLEKWNLMANKDNIPAGTIILSGTPHGVLFKKANMWNPGVFLKPGDQVMLRGEGFGFIRNTIVK